MVTGIQGGVLEILPVNVATHITIETLTTTPHLKDQYGNVSAANANVHKSAARVKKIGVGVTVATGIFSCGNPTLWNKCPQ